MMLVFISLSLLGSCPAGAKEKSEAQTLGIIAGEYIPK